MRRKRLRKRANVPWCHRCFESQFLGTHASSCTISPVAFSTKRIKNKEINNKSWIMVCSQVQPLLHGKGHAGQPPGPTWVGASQRVEVMGSPTHGWWTNKNSSPCNNPNPWSMGLKTNLFFTCIIVFDQPNIQFQSGLDWDRWQFNRVVGVNMLDSSQVGSIGR